MMCLKELEYINVHAWKLNIMIWDMTLHNLPEMDQFNRKNQQMHKYYNIHFHIQSANIPTCFDPLTSSSASLTSHKHIQNTYELSNRLKFF